jgi:hypothetical protein
MFGGRCQGMCPMCGAPDGQMLAAPANRPQLGASMPLIKVTLIEGVSTVQAAMSANELDTARKHGLALRDPAHPELGWRRTTTFAIANFTCGPRSGHAPSANADSLKQKEQA